ncbi:Eco57I restriction-modification methylase domain-containing protein [Methanocorpusculum vombati]|uniref:site-specific DNA-methyltransferase (adenine-specific) n=1 Tax=Methanocorpusculum vombati TaxID=3002864 RepID=A0ABT4IKL4_9EURY|nr:Eco57I restriction-modification methylase domain-containing protein [Methanocorpusculum vombati]MCZ9319600.1 Eco57I restriction-modification methylase domain-containing protein [Methanocorpusculum sp.]MCZ0862289.1 Eco57I restriction-modification methylase domain-containing protein [Methanocorpusculum vombati]MDE2520688.1 Eco57I restriction-modification methylase domain-containing protein [Methanocorpusculum sp.]MDE2534451.1 Eco57I restriction-modification methylase domain-containing protein 
MSEESTAVKSYNPDVLTCIANLSNDEIFTPPKLANQILDLLPEEIWHDKTTTFLDPATKTGVFLREIAARLLVGLEEEIPDLQERVNHICKNQIFGIAITELTALISRRSLYCSKIANGQYSICTCFEGEDGNIKLERTEHTWKNGKCIFCGAPKKMYERGEELESYAYQFIHTKTPEEIFQMKFDVIVSNPPYQLIDGGGNGASAKPIYQLFVQQAKKLKPRYLTMIIPSRWFTGGKGLDEFRDEMLHDDRIRVLHDYPEATDCFSGVQIKGGISYFLWDRENRGLCKVYSHNEGVVSGPVERPLLEPDCDTFIRYNEAIGILHKVNKVKSPSMEQIISSRLPFGLTNTFKGNKEKKSESDLKIYVSGNNREIRGTTAYVPLDMICRGKEMISWHKVYIAKAGSGSDTFPHPILPKPFYGAPNTVCNESYLVIGPFSNESECENVISYISTKFFRFLVLQKKNSQNAARGVYKFVPQQDFSKPWTDEELYIKYGLTEEEIAFIESMIKPMETA